MDDSSTTLSTLCKAGLTPSQAKGYLALVHQGEFTPAALAEYIGENRTNGYMICEKLETLGLALKKDSKKTVYMPATPARLRTLIVERQRQLKKVNDELTGLIPSLTTQFHLNSDGVMSITLEGVDGLQTLYQDILKTGQDLCIIASTIDRIDPEISREIDTQIARQQRAVLKSRVLWNASAAEIQQLANTNIEVRATPVDSTAQFIMYENNIAISTFRHGMITSLITHPDITNSFRAIFETMWSQANTTASQQ